MAKKNKGGRILKTALCVILVLVLAAGVTVWGLFRNEITTLNSLKHEAANYYTIDYKADYGLDEFLKEGASTDGELAAFIIRKVLKGLPVNISLPDLGCSAFNAITPDGDRIFGRNFDNKDAEYVLVHTKPKSGYESISMANLTFIGFDNSSLIGRLLTLAAPYIPLDGINEKGLSIGVLQLYTESTHQDTGKTDITTTSAIRMVLDTCATVDEAIEAMANYDMQSSANAPYHFQIADANGDTATIEYLDDVMHIYRDASGYTCTTNFVLTEGEYYNNGTGQDRFDILRTKLDETNGTLTEDNGMLLLKSVSQDIISDKGDRISTLWSAVYNNTDRTADICINMDYDTVYRYGIDGKAR